MKEGRNTLLQLGKLSLFSIGLCTNATDVKVVKNNVELTYGTQYNATIGNGGIVTLSIAANVGDVIVVYSGTPETRETNFTRTSVNVTAANKAIDILTEQTPTIA